MLREFSAGAVVLREVGGKWWIAVIEPTRASEPDTNRAVIALPKGNIDAGEKPEETAKREVLEETGIHAQMVAKLASTQYVYQRKWANGEKVFKIVTFYLMKYRSGSIGEITEEMKHEVTRAYWLPLADAAAKLSYGGEKQMVAKVVEYLEQHAEELRE
ncbi:MAG TPA: NUDIX domain-containing protein [Candidatus Angelobacter sp.]|nr:NUDIX domain-containing protein [Candidatus Angelobacter sp.]